ncbi:MAG: hypothetical protein SYC29_11540 [Planctomycetota bacterium]|nr:hypothetical protein [Planctomycetota bacterium]
MTIDPIQLLKRLEPAVRPGSAPASAREGQAPLEQRSFEDLLSLVSRGSVHSGRPITVAGAASLKEELDDDQKGRLASAADTAQAAGAKRAVMLIDGRGLVLDVAGRVIETELGPGGKEALTNLDAAVYVAAREEEQSAARGPALPDAGVLRPALTRHREIGAATPPDPATEDDSTEHATRPRRIAG